MADPTKAEIMLDQVTKINALIRRFQLCKDHPIPPLRLDLWPSTKSTIKAYQENVQGRIDQLTAQRETVLALVEQIPDGEVQTVLKLRYGLLDNSTKKMPWMDIPLQQWGSRRLPHPPRNNVDPVQWVGVNRYSLFRVSEMSG